MHLHSQILFSLRLKTGVRLLLRPLSPLSLPSVIPSLLLKGFTPKIPPLSSLQFLPPLVHFHQAYGSLPSTGPTLPYPSPLLGSRAASQKHHWFHCLCSLTWTPCLNPAQQARSWNSSYLSPHHPSLSNQWSVFAHISLPSNT